MIPWPSMISLSVNTLYRKVFWIKITMYICGMSLGLTLGLITTYREGMLIVLICCISHLTRILRSDVVICMIVEDCFCWSRTTDMQFRW